MHIFSELVNTSLMSQRLPCRISVEPCVEQRLLQWRYSGGSTALLLAHGIGYITRRLHAVMHTYSSPHHSAQETAWEVRKALASSSPSPRARDLSASSLRSFALAAWLHSSFDSRKHTSILARRAGAVRCRPGGTASFAALLRLERSMGSASVDHPPAAALHPPFFLVGVSRRLCTGLASALETSLGEQVARL